MHVSRTALTLGLPWLLLACQSGSQPTIPSDQPDTSQAQVPISTPADTLLPQPAQEIPPVTLAQYPAEVREIIQSLADVRRSGWAAFAPHVNPQRPILYLKPGAGVAPILASLEWTELVDVDPLTATLEWMATANPVYYFAPDSPVCEWEQPGFHLMSNDLPSTRFQEAYVIQANNNDTAIDSTFLRQVAQTEREVKYELRVILPATEEAGATAFSLLIAEVQGQWHLVGIDARDCGA